MIIADANPHEVSRANVMRQVRLRSASAHLYPVLPSGKWLPAGEVAARLLAEGARRGDVRSGRDRILPEEHFEFRGGRREETLRYRARTRWTDYPGSLVR